jgi:acyl-CoA synthetase (NDP forming)
MPSRQTLLVCKARPGETLHRANLRTMNETPIAFLRLPGDANKSASTMTAYWPASARTPPKGHA